MPMVIANSTSWTQLTSYAGQKAAIKIDPRANSFVWVIIAASAPSNSKEIPAAGDESTVMGPGEAIDLQGVMDNAYVYVRSDKGYVHVFSTDAAGVHKQYETIIHKFGFSDSIGTGFAPLAYGNIYRTPQVSGATQLRIKAGGNANDTAAGSGAREVTLIGLDATGAEITEAVATNGASASSATTNSFLRLYRAYVSASGTYASQAAGSHSGDIVIEDSAGTEDWATIPSTGFPRGQSEIAVYSVPLGYKAALRVLTIIVDSAKSVDVILFTRENILETAAPYSSMRVVRDFAGAAGILHDEDDEPRTYPALTDIGFMAKVASGTGKAFVQMELALFPT